MILISFFKILETTIILVLLNVLTYSAFFFIVSDVNALINSTTIMYGVEIMRNNLVLT